MRSHSQIGLQLNMSMKLVTFLYVVCLWTFCQGDIQKRSPINAPLLGFFRDLISLASPERSQPKAYYSSHHHYHQPSQRGYYSQPKYGGYSGQHHNTYRPVKGNCFQKRSNSGYYGRCYISCTYCNKRFCREIPTGEYC